MECEQRWHSHDIYEKHNTDWTIKRDGLSLDWVDDDVEAEQSFLWLDEMQI